jgi:hypothetical protein
MKYLLIAPSVIDCHIERTADSNDYLLTGTVSMATTALTTGNIVGPIDASDVERDVLHLFRYCQIATRIDNLGKTYHS